MPPKNAYEWTVVDENGVEMEPLDFIGFLKDLPVEEPPPPRMNDLEFSADFFISWNKWKRIMYNWTARGPVRARMLRRSYMQSSWREL